MFAPPPQAYGTLKKGAAANPALWIDRLAIRAERGILDPKLRTSIGLPDLEDECRSLAVHSARDRPLPAPSIGFDRPANIYVVTELYPAGGHRFLLERMIDARPRERHIVLFTGAMNRAPDYGIARMREIGAFAIAPDWQGALFDRYEWLRRKLAAFAAQRVFLFHHMHDVLAAAAAYEIAPRYGRRLYMVRHADIHPTLGAELDDATHIVIRDEHARLIKDQYPNMTCLSVGLAHSAACASSERKDEGFLKNGSLTTATSGADHKFEQKGNAAFGSVILKTLLATRGRHIHIGSVSDSFRQAAFKTLEVAGVRKERLVFLGEVDSLQNTLIQQQVDLFIASFPIGGGLSVCEAAAAGLPIAVYDPGSRDKRLRYIAGTTHRPQEALVWSDAEELLAFLMLRQESDDVTLSKMAQSSIDWYNRCLSPAKFGRRLTAILAVSEGRARTTISEVRNRVLGEVFDANWYLDSNPDVAAAKVDPLLHFIGYGESEGRRCCALFDVDFYLAQLSEGERRIAEQSPITHYALRGEPRGLRPHPLFDPTLAKASLEGDDISVTHSCTLAAYMSRPGSETRTHMFFNGRHYARARGYCKAENKTLLQDFLDRGIKLGLSPHPLIEMGRFGKDPSANFLAYLTKDSPQEFEFSPHPLFDPQMFCSGDALPWRGAASNLLWAHLIEGNKPGRDPHLLVSISFITKLHAEILLDPQTVLERLVKNEFEGDTHVLVDSSWICRQAPWLNSTSLHPTLYFLRCGLKDNIDPCRYFSTYYYFQNNVDVAQAEINPLIHYIRFGEREGRSPHMFFDSNWYYHAFLARRAKPFVGALIDYAQYGAGEFRNVRSLDAHFQAMIRKMSVRLLQLGDELGAAQMLHDSMQAAAAPEHPTLVCEVRELNFDLPGKPSEWFGTARVHVARPSVVHPGHIAPESGSYDVDGPAAACCEEVTILGGNDGIVLKDGRLFDPGLHHFDATRMQPKENTSLVSVNDDCTRALLRWHEHDTSFKSGVFSCGSYSANYYHFLIEVLPRVMTADRIAPASVPILTDRHMPVQHFQILRMLFPERPVRTLLRNFSYRVEKLYVGNMANVVHDVATADKAPVDAVRYHPELVKRLNAIARGFASDGSRRKVYFRRESEIRRIRNAANIERELIARGFEVVNCAQLSFSEQVALAANAEVIVAQSGAHLANILFARPGTRVFVLYSNAPCTNYYLWDGLGRILGLDIVNVAGWRIPGSSPPGVARLHDDFILPPELLLAFFEDRDCDGALEIPEDLVGCLSALYDANAEADTITAAWSIMSRRTPDWFNKRLQRLRAAAGQLLDEADDDQIEDILSHPFFADFGRNIRSGYAALRSFSADEQELIASLRVTYEEWAADPKVWVRQFVDDEEGWDVADARQLPTTEVERMLALAMLYLAPRELPLPADISILPARLAERFVGWLVAPPFLFREGDDAAYVDFIERLLVWFDRQFDEADSDEATALLYKMATDIDFGQLLLIDGPLLGVFEARNRLLERLTPHDETKRLSPRKSDGCEGRLRLGILCRTFDMGPDSEAVASFLRGFDKTRYELFAYSVCFRDRVVSASGEFDAQFDAVIDHRRSLTGDPRDMRESFLADDLDVFVHANATSFGLQAQELALYRRIAPMQMILNSHVPMSTGFPSFDVYLTGKSDNPAFEIDEADHTETLARIEGSVICYLNSRKARREPVFDRAALGLAEEDVVLMNAGSLSKLRRDCLLTFMAALKSAPTTKLLLAPYNPGWAARSQAFAFNQVVEEAAADAGVDMDRILIMSELSVAEAESALTLCDIYLNPFPHGGATMTHLALINGKPPVTLRRRSSRSIDQFLIQSIGATELLVNSEADYVDLTRRLAVDPNLRQSISTRFSNAAQKPPFVSNLDFSRDMQRVIDQVLDTFRTHDGQDNASAHRF